LVAGVLTWKDCLEYSPAWDTLIWFAILISMSNGLNESGLITTFAGIVGEQLTALNLGWQPVFFILHTAFFGLHYLFASQTAHIGALYAAFLAMMIAAGACSSSSVGGGTLNCFLSLRWPVHQIVAASGASRLAAGVPDECIHPMSHSPCGAVLASQPASKSLRGLCHT
jgi:hypothetical protein